MAGGWAPDSAVTDQIEDSIADGVAFARSRLPGGVSAEYCVACDEPIPEKRRLAVPGVQTCVACQAGRDRQPAMSGINRRGSKDSQLR